VLLQLVPAVLLAIACCWAIDWRRAWRVLAAGGWAPLVLIAIMAAAVWTFLWPTPVLVLGSFTVANGVWQFGAVGLFVGLMLFCGWLQSRTDYAPPEFNFDEPVHTHDDHSPAHAHH
jgi:hypothetical protein